MGNDTLRGIGSLVTFIAGTAFLLLQLGFAFPVVREHCADLEATAATQQINIDSKWTYILWPPLYLAPLDPAGRCVRNSPAREFADAIGVWKLPDPKEQVRRHIAEQLKDRSGP
jgi:hypothetical protein